MSWEFDGGGFHLAAWECEKLFKKNYLQCLRELFSSYFAKEMCDKIVFDSHENSVLRNKQQLLVNKNVKEKHYNNTNHQQLIIENVSNKKCNQYNQKTTNNNEIRTIIYTIKHKLRQEGHKYTHTHIQRYLDRIN